MAKESTLGKVVSWLLVIGGLNLGLVAAVNVDVIGMLGVMVARIVSVLVGLSALYSLVGMFKK